MDRNLALEFVRVTEAGAIASASWWGKGDKNGADGAAVKAVRDRFEGVDFEGEVVIGEGEKDHAPFLYTGEKLGTGNGISVDIAIDPVEGTTPLATGKEDSLCVLAAAPRGKLLKVPGTYMDQIAVGPKAKGVIDINQTVTWNVKAVAKAIGKDVEELTVAILDRDRHKDRIAELRACGCRVKLIDHGTVSAGLATSFEEISLDMMIGIGGAPEAILTAAGLKCLCGDMQAKLTPHNDEMKSKAQEMGFTDLEKVYMLDDLCKGEEAMFVATGITEGFLKGVLFTPDGIKTQSIVMRAKTKTLRWVDAIHHHEHTHL